MFQSATENNIDLYAASVSSFINNCIGDVVTIVTIKTYPNQKPWMDGGNRAKLKAQSTAFNHGKMTGNMNEYNYSLRNYSLRKAIKQAKCRFRDKVEPQVKGSDMRLTWQGLQEIMDCKNKNSHATDTASCFQTN